MTRSTNGLEALRTDYLGSNLSSTCNSAGSALWALAKNMKPLVDANCHTEAIELGNDRSPIQFSPILYKNPGTDSEHRAGQIMLFGCRPEPHIDGQQKEAPSIFVYLLEGTSDPDNCYWIASVSQRTDIITNNSLYGRQIVTGIT